MNAGEIILKIALWASAVVGFVVFASNRRRSANQAFFVLTLTIAAWLGSVLEVFHSRSASRAAEWIRSASITGAPCSALIWVEKPSAAAVTLCSGSEVVKNS